MPTVNDIEWFKQNFGGEISAALTGIPFDLDMIVAVACQETGYIWSRLRRANLPLERIVALCVGDTIDHNGPGRGRQVFPLNKDDLLSRPKGQRMFNIARKALEDMAEHVPGYDGAVENPKKFCHGFGIFQRDLQFFKNDPDYFLERRYEVFTNTLDHCLKELQRGLRVRGYESRTDLTDFEFATVAIVYNTGGYNPAKRLKQGHFDGTKYYGERIFDYLKLSRTVDAAATLAAGRYVVVARNGLNLRGTASTDSEPLDLLPAGTELTVVSLASQDSSWALVDLQDDGLLDGYVFASFLAPVGLQGSHGESVPEPG